MPGIPIWPSFAALFRQVSEAFWGQIGANGGNEELLGGMIL
ncbi:hypothetical protein CYA_2764 [Synechococcus sp. JA-3-3Ab]|nr:hypothetical protein CYA_2764 [Synechococcus sp. JA-3-3Ab]